MSREPGRRLVLAALGAYVGLVLVVVVAPVSYADVVHAIDSVLRDGLGVAWFGSGWIEFAANILLFVPLGLLLTLLVDRVWIGVAVCVAASVAVELAQFLLPSRQASPRDVIANAIGAGVGAAIAWLIVRRRRGRGGSDG